MPTHVLFASLRPHHDKYLRFEITYSAHASNIPDNVYDTEIEVVYGLCNTEGGKFDTYLGTWREDTSEIHMTFQLFNKEWCLFELMENLFNYLELRMGNKSIKQWAFSGSTWI